MEGMVAKNSALALCTAVKDNALCNRIQTSWQAIGPAGEHFM